MPTLKMSKTLTATPLILPKTRTSCQRIAMAGSQQVVLVGLGLAIFMMPGQLQLIGQYQTARGLGKVERLWDIFFALASFSPSVFSHATVLHEHAYRARRRRSPGWLQPLAGQHSSDFAVMMAASVMAMAPIFLLFFAMQKRVIEGLASSGLKG